jgi:hypothetical protein
MQDRVLADLFAWLESPARTARNLEVQIQADAIIIESLQRQLTNQTQQLEVARNETRSVQTQLTNDLNASNALINDLQSSLSTYMILTYIALIIAAIAMIGTILTLRKRTISEPKNIG